MGLGYHIVTKCILAFLLNVHILYGVFVTLFSNVCFCKKKWKAFLEKNKQINIPKYSILDGSKGCQYS